MAAADSTIRTITISGPIVLLPPGIETHGAGGNVSQPIETFDVPGEVSNIDAAPASLTGMEQEIRACLDQKQYREAFDRLLPEFQHKVFRLAYAMLGEAGAAEDMAQDVFIRIWKALPGYRGQSSLSTWIYAITRNACLSALRKVGVKREVSMEEPGVARAAEATGLEAGGGAGIDVLRFLKQLPEKHQQVLRLYYLEEKSYEEVARLLEWPMGTVKVYLHRARKELAEAVARGKI
jgi:RNA polymerase sigma-70 factor (ECF subfamily)